MQRGSYETGVFRRVLSQFELDRSWKVEEKFKGKGGRKERGIWSKGGANFFRFLSLHDPGRLMQMMQFTSTNLSYASVLLGASHLFCLRSRSVP